MGTLVVKYFPELSALGVTKALNINPHCVVEYGDDEAVPGCRVVE